VPEKFKIDHGVGLRHSKLSLVLSCNLAITHKPFKQPVVFILSLLCVNVPSILSAYLEEIIFYHKDLVETI